MTYYLSISIFGKIARSEFNNDNELSNRYLTDSTVSVDWTKKGAAKRDGLRRWRALWGRAGMPIRSIGDRVALNSRLKPCRTHRCRGALLNLHPPNAPHRRPQNEHGWPWRGLKIG